jgi:hypothetical protein
MTNEIANKFLMGGGGKSASFKAIGDAVTGTITNMEERQQTDFDSGKPLEWENGSPRNQLVISLLTEESVDEDDDGMRRLYVKGNLQRAIREAVIKSGKRVIADGSILSVTYIGDDVPTRKGMSGAKKYSAVYEPGIVLASVENE